jgi:hypothetical protein
MSGGEERDEGREERGFVVIDRRGRGEDEAPAEGSAPSGGGARPSSEAAPSTSPAEPGSPPAGTERKGAGTEPAAPTVDFATLVQSFFVTALYHLGLAPDPESGRPGEPDFPLARQNIDILELIQAKTRGNLDADEERLLEGLLYEVRMRFVEASQARGT